MAIEREHKYLVISDEYREMSVSREEIVQGYLDRTPSHTIRIRRKGNHCYLTIKGITRGDSREEYEYAIPEDDFMGMLGMCEGDVLSKTRYIVPYAGMEWEVDEFHGRRQGLVLAEIELAEGVDDYNLPPFVGENVTGRLEYYNSNL